MKIGIFGNFGWGNLGNSATLEAVLAGARKQWPGADIVCVCTHPEEVHQQYGLEVVPVRWGVDEGLRLPGGRVRRMAAKTLQRPPHELQLWRRARLLLEELDLFMIAGTGILDDFAIGPLDMPFDLYKWSLQAFRSHVPLVYLSTGAGPIDQLPSRILIRLALQQAIYRSYRDEYSRTYLRTIGFDTSHDPIYPDLAFGLSIAPALLKPAHALSGDRPLDVGLGIMTYSGSHTNEAEGEDIYRTYLSKIVEFGSRLLAGGHTVRLVLGDTHIDQRAFDDVHRALATEAAALKNGGRVLAEPAQTVDDLLHQLAQADLVVATRFHNVLLALLLQKPVISISYNQKNDDLLRAAGLGAFCQPLLQLDVERLYQQFLQLQAEAPSIRDHLAAYNAEQRRLLDEQYARVGTLVSTYPRRNGAVQKGLIPHE
jgi:polysaccharide pyruvyl transferase WcaK-like protein